MMTDTLQKLRAPAIALIVAGSLNGMIGLLSLLSGLLRLSGMGGREMLPVDEAERLGYMISTVVAYGVSLISLVLAPVIIYGATKMMQAKKYKVARLAAILAILPFTSCCFLVGLPMGIWALAILAQTDVKAAFNYPSVVHLYPPQPSQNW